MLSVETLRGELLAAGFSRVNVVRVSAICVVPSPADYARELCERLPGLRAVWRGLTGEQQSSVQEYFKREAEKSQGSRGPWLFECPALLAVGLK